jgi:hypothetical protein
VLAEINPVVLPALRIAATFSLLVNVIGGYISFEIVICSSTRIPISRRTLSPCAN